MSSSLTDLSKACSSTSKLGYAHPDYAASLAEFGSPRHLAHCDGWILERDIPGSSHKDAMGCYPFFSCRNWYGLTQDFAELQSDIVSLVLVTDPFAEFDPADLKSGFDTVSHFKDHFVAETNQPLEDIVKKSHRATVRRASKKVDVSVCANPIDRLDEWSDFFAVLSQRHNISGLRAFSRKAFEIQLAIPGLVMFEAWAEDQIVGLDLWYVAGDVAYGHLVAFNELGYKYRASYATKWHVLTYFKDKVRWIDFGGAAGAGGQAGDGLTDFKRGWSTGTKPVYLCTRVLQQEPYDQLTAARSAEGASYFPAYRQGEFT